MAALVGTKGPSHQWDRHLSHKLARRFHPGSWVWLEPPAPCSRSCLKGGCLGDDGEFMTSHPLLLENGATDASRGCRGSCGLDE